MESLTLLQPLWLIPTALLLVTAFYFRVNAQQDDWRKVISPSVLNYLRSRNDIGGSNVNWHMLAAAVCTLALSSPATRNDTENTLLHSTTWLILLDVSRSMTTQDVAPSRLSAARNTILQLSSSANSRSLGLIIFAGDAYLASPPAFDKHLLEESAALLEYGIIPQDGSNLARALSLASSVVTDSQLASGRLFLLTDSGGINNTAQAAARFLHKQGQRLDIIVYGSATGDPNIALDIGQVEALATAGGGEMIRASNFGAVNLDALGLEETDNADYYSADLTALHWRNQSHWILLLLLPILINLFRHEMNL